MAGIEESQGLPGFEPLEPAGDAQGQAAAARTGAHYAPAPTGGAVPSVPDIPDAPFVPEVREVPGVDGAQGSQEVPVPADAAGDASASGNPSLAPAEVYSGGVQRTRGSRLSTRVWLLLLAVVAAVAAGGGYYYAMTHPGEGPHFGTLSGKTTLTERELDEAVATYTVGGTTYEVTAREAILQQSSLDIARVSEGVYLMPSTESVVSAARTAILQAEVDRRGITVSDEEMDAYVQQTFGTTEYATLASEFHMDEENVRRLLRGSAGMAKLRAEVVAAATTSEPEPAAPAKPDNGDANAASADYAAYIIALAGDEWDAEKGGWVSFDGPYAAALREYDVRADSAPYAAAEVAYNLAYEQYHANQGEQPSESAVWTDFVNGLLCEAKLAVGSLAS